MTKIIILITALFLVPAYAADAFPHDVRVFLYDADLCDHLADEVGGARTREEVEELGRESHKYCFHLGRWQDVLRHKYKNDKKMIDEINKFDESDTL